MKRMMKIYSALIVDRQEAEQIHDASEHGDIDWLLEEYEKNDNSNFREEFVRIAQNDQFYRLIADDPDEYVRSEIASNTNDSKLLAKLAYDEDPKVRRKVAVRTKDTNLIEKFKKDPDGEVRRMVVLNLGDEETFKEFVSDPYWVIRESIAKHTEDPDLLSKLSKDSDEDVKSEAKHRMKKLGLTTHRRSNGWGDLISNLNNDLDEDIDPIYEQTEAGKILENVCLEVEDSMNLYVEPSIQGGVGGVWIYDNTDNSTLVEDYDYESFNSRVIDIALSSTNKSNFKQKYKKYLQNMISKSLKNF